MSNQVKLFGSSRTGARIAKNKKPKKQKKPLKVLAIWLAVILCLEGLYFFAVYTDNSFVSYWRTTYINTALSTMRHQWLATALLPKDVVQAVVDRNTKAAESFEIKSSTWGTEAPDSTDTPAVTPADQPDPDGPREIEVEITPPRNGSRTMPP